MTEKQDKTPMITPIPGMIIRESVRIKPGIYHFDDGNGLIIQGRDIQIDGAGVILMGPGSERSGIDSFKGVGLRVEQSEEISIKNFTIKGFQLGLQIQSSSQVRIESNDLSDNYDDKDYGWGDGNPYGALLLENSHRSQIIHNKAKNVWNGIFLKESHENEIRDNAFSHCSNVCLLLWSSCRNQVESNDFSWGLRIKPGEVHARDSTSLLLEHGSNDNHFISNDFTHGGDGIFIRSLDGVISTGNLFEGNDASYANNNAIECWSPGNRFIRNKACFSSYGFWMGGSDDSWIIDNEIAYNGRDYHNAPEKDFGNAGIAVVHGSSDHFRIIGNYIHHNHGVGIAAGFKQTHPAYHWIVQNNRIENNSSHAVYLRDSRCIHIAGNDMVENGGEKVYLGPNVSDVKIIDSVEGEKAPQAMANVSSTVIRLGEDVVFDARESKDSTEKPLSFRWELGDGTQGEGAVIRHRYRNAGYYRVALSVSNGDLEDIKGFRIYVHRHAPDEQS